MTKKLITIISAASATFLLSLFSGCNTSKISSVNETEELGDKSLWLKLVSIYDPVSIEDSQLPEYIMRTENILDESFTNTFHRTLLGKDYEIQELRLSNGHVFAVFFTQLLHEDPIPSVETPEVKKIIYGYSVDQGIVIEDPDALRSIIDCIKRKTLAPPHRSVLVLPTEDKNYYDIFNQNGFSVHGCTMALRIVLKNGDVVVTGGHIEDRDWNPQLFEVFSKIIEQDQISIIGNTSVEDLLGIYTD